MIHEVERKLPNGLFMLLVLFVLTVLGAYGFVHSLPPEGQQPQSVPAILAWVFALLVVAVGWKGLFIVNPNEAEGPPALREVRGDGEGSRGSGGRTPSTRSGRSRSGCGTSRRRR